MRMMYMKRREAAISLLTNFLALHRESRVDLVQNGGCFGCGGVQKRTKSVLNALLKYVEKLVDGRNGGRVVRLVTVVSDHHLFLRQRREGGCHLCKIECLEKNCSVRE